MKSFAGKVAVVTGAASGMGRELALQLSQAGAKVAISDVNPTGLAETAQLIQAKGGEVHSEVINVAEREAVIDWADRVAAHYGKVNLIFNNAGIAHYGEVEEMEFKDIERVMDIDFWGVVNGTKAFLPHLIASGEGHVVNTSSVFGILSVPGQSAYNAAKFAVRGFTEALRIEMLSSKHNVQVTSVHPGGIKTNIVNSISVSGDRSARSIQKFFDRVAITTSESAAKTILNGVRKNRGRVLIGPDAVAFDAVARVVGPVYTTLAAKLVPLSGAKF